MPAALRQFRAHQGEHFASLAKEIWRCLDDESARMCHPYIQDSPIDGCGFACRFRTKRVLMVVAAADWRRAEMDDCVVAPELVLQCGAHGVEVIVGSRPIG